MILGGKLGNRCKVMPVYDLLRAAIRDFRGQTWQSLQDFPQKRPRGCSDSGFQAKTCKSMQRRKVPPAVVVAATRSASDSNLRCSKVEWFRLPQSSRQRRIARLPQSSRQRRMARLQQSRWVQAGTGCHEGGIILIKKPPEWHLSPPQQRSASEANLRFVN